MGENGTFGDIDPPSQLSNPLLLPVPRPNRVSQMSPDTLDTDTGAAPPSYEYFR